MSRKVLVVDDEKLIVKGLRFSLEQDGKEVDCAYDGEEALEKAKAGEYDIINIFCTGRIRYIIQPFIMTYGINNIFMKLIMILSECI